MSAAIHPVHATLCGSGDGYRRQTHLPRVPVAGVLVQSNFGGALTINGAPVGRELGCYSFQRTLQTATEKGDGSIMIVVATDAPLNARTLDRLALRALIGLGRTGGNLSNGSGDYVIAFSTATSVRRRDGEAPRTVEDLPNSAMSPLFHAVAEATEEAIYNSILKATTTRGQGREVSAIPIDQVVDVLRKYNGLGWDRTLPPRHR
jgi:D-aminopeptidase